MAKKIRSTNAQIRYLIDFMSKHPELDNGMYASPEYNKYRDEIWVQLQTELKEYGPEKSITQLKHSWRDLKRHARTEKRKAMETEDYELSSQARAVLDVIGDESDQDKTQESGDLVFQTKKDTCRKKHNNSEHSYAGKLNEDEKPLLEVGEDPLVYEVEALEDTSTHIQTFTFPRFTDHEPNVPSEHNRRRRYSDSSNSNSHIKPRKIRKPNGQNCPKKDKDILSTFNRFIDYEKEKEKLAHEREMKRIEQNDNMIKLFGRFVSVVEDLAPSIKNFLSTTSVNNDKS